jgi:nitrite reductase/ring-hydroxylating ferredoxin subunit
MGELDHWHPVLRSEELKKKPAAVRLAGEELVVFRAGDGRLGALADRCPHRGMRLSLGAVDGSHLVCPYHGFRWAPDGQGSCPGTPAARPCAPRYDVVERLGAVWVKRAGAVAAFPSFDVTGWTPVGRLRRRAQAPLELVLDNFIEVEHTPTTHALFGYPLDRMAEVETRATIAEDSIRVYNIGPQRRLPAGLRAVYGFPEETLFVDDWTTRFSPVYTVYDQRWLDARTREELDPVLRLAVFMNPVGPTETELFVFSHIRSTPWGRFGLNGLIALLSGAFITLEVLLDCRMLARLADKDTSIRGNTLGRFDKPLMAARRKIDRLYRGRPDGALPVIER